METSLRAMSAIMTIVGALGVAGGFAQPNATEAAYSFTGGALCLAQGILTIVYIDRTRRARNAAEKEALVKDAVREVLREQRLA